MHWRNEKEWALWEDRMINGSLHSFAHLRSFDMAVLKDARGDQAQFKATVRVVFDCHVITESAEFVDGDPHYWQDTGGKGRRFETQRYQYSFALPGLIAGLPTGKIKCYIGKHNNYMVWKPADAPSPQVHYQAYFDIYKPSNQPPGHDPLLILYVQSAYLKDEPFAAQRERFKSFGKICAELAGVILLKPKGPHPKKKS